MNWAKSRAIKVKSYQSVKVYQSYQRATVI